MTDGRVEQPTGTTGSRRPRRRKVLVAAGVVGALAVVGAGVGVGVALGGGGSSQPSPAGSGVPAGPSPAPGPAVGGPTAADFAGSQYPVAPYVDPSQILGPSKAGSFNAQPWRGWLQTVPADQMLSGVGLNYNPPATTDNGAMIGALAADGIRSLRIGIGWNHMDVADTALNPADAARLSSIFAACHRYGVTPTILLDADSAAPEPTAPGRSVTVTAAAPVGATSLHVASTAGLVVGHSGIDATVGKSTIQAGVLFSAIAPDGTVTLSRPLTTAVASGASVTVHTLQWLPLYPASTPQFAATASAWVAYAQAVSKLVADAGITDFDVETWNELTFGSQFLDIGNYVQPSVANVKQGNFKPGGAAWTLVQRTADALHQTYGNHVRVIWAYSNTDFQITSVKQLPHGVDAQSYHPYHNRPMSVASWVKATGSTPLNSVLDQAPAPTTPIDIPESLFVTAIKTESLTERLLPPKVRAGFDNAIPGFTQLITENGVAPGAAGIKVPAQAATYRAKMALRNYAFWLDKGISSVDLYALWGKGPLSYGFLGPSTPHPSDSTEMRSIGNYTRAFAGAQPIAQPTQLSVDVAAVGRQYDVDPGTPAPLPYRNLFAFLPYQVTATRFVAAVYDLTYDLLTPLPGGTMNFRVTVHTGGAAVRSVGLYDPLTNRTVPAPVLGRGPGTVTVGVAATDYPRLLTLVT